jgi:hypothetical protein
MLRFSSKLWKGIEPIPSKLINMQGKNSPWENEEIKKRLLCRAPKRQ